MSVHRDVPIDDREVDLLVADDDPEVVAGMAALATLRELEAIEAAMTDGPA